MLQQADLLDFDSDSDTSETTRSFYHRNALGSVMEITDMNEAVAVSYRYDPYGAVTITRSSQVQSSDPLGQPWMYTGRFSDEETGLYYYRARYYSSETGRFLQRDPLGYRPGRNLYEYVRSAPSVFVDPLGLKYFTPGYEDLGEIEGKNSAGQITSIEHAVTVGTVTLTGKHKSMCKELERVPNTYTGGCRTYITCFEETYYFHWKMRLVLYDQVEFTTQEDGEYMKDRLLPGEEGGLTQIEDTFIVPRPDNEVRDMIYAWIRRSKIRGKGLKRSAAGWWEYVPGSFQLDGYTKKGKPCPAGAGSLGGCTYGICPIKGFAGGRSYISKYDKPWADRMRRHSTPMWSPVRGTRIPPGTTKAVFEELRGVFRHR